MTIGGVTVNVKAVLGWLAVVGGVVTALVSNSSILHLPSSVSSVLVVIGGVIVAAERFATSVDTKTVSTERIEMAKLGQAPPAKATKAAATTK